MHSLKHTQKHVQSTKQNTSRTMHSQKPNKNMHKAQIWYIHRKQHRVQNTHTLKKTCTNYETKYIQNSAWSKTKQKHAQNDIYNTPKTIQSPKHTKTCTKQKTIPTQNNEQSKTHTKRQSKHETEDHSLKHKSNTKTQIQHPKQECNSRNLHAQNKSPNLSTPCKSSIKVMDVPSTQVYFSRTSSGTSAFPGIQPYLQHYMQQFLFMTVTYELPPNPCWMRAKVRIKVKPSYL